MQESLDANFQNVSGLKISDDAKTFILETARWAKFLAIVGFVFLGLMLIAAFPMMVLGAALPGMATSGAGAGLLYLLMVVLYFFPTYYLYSFSNKVKVGLMNSNQTELDAGFENLKSTFKFMGILMIIVLGIYALALVFALIAGVAAGSM